MMRCAVFFIIFGEYDGPARNLAKNSCPICCLIPVLGFDPTSGVTIAWAVRGIIFDIKRFALHDGPGLRTTVFLKGCPLQCAWCHNPESRDYGIKHYAGRGGPVTVGRKVTLDEVMMEIERDLVFYDESRGGVTFSGGEPLAQPKFLTALLECCGERGIHRAVDTSGHAPTEVLLRAAATADLILYDVKLAGSQAHLRHTGVDGELIRRNLVKLCETETPIELRFPLIPGVTGTEANLLAVRDFLASLPRQLPLTVLPYHRASSDKYDRFGIESLLPETSEPTEKEVENCRAFFRDVTAGSRPDSPLIHHPNTQPAYAIHD